MEKYKEKLKKLEENRGRWNSLLGESQGEDQKTQRVVELVDSAGERKYVRTKRD